MTNSWHISLDHLIDYCHIGRDSPLGIAVVCIDCIQQLELLFGYNKEHKIFRVSLKNSDTLAIPKEILSHCGIEPGTELECLIQDDKLIFRKYHTSCIFCERTEDMKELNNSPVCPACAQDIHVCYRKFVMKQPEGLSRCEFLDPDSDEAKQWSRTVW